MKQWIRSGGARHVALWVLLSALVSPGAAAAGQDPSPEPPMVLPEPPSLAEIARLEQARRKVLRGASKVYSDKDVRRAASEPAAPSPEPASPDATPVPDAPAPAAGQGRPPAQGEDFWKNRMTQALEEVRRNEVFAKALESRIEALTNDFVRAEPYQRAGISEERQKALAELERVKGEVERGNRTVTDIEEEARKAAIPPGWLR